MPKDDSAQSLPSAEDVAAFSASDAQRLADGLQQLFQKSGRTLQQVAEAASVHRNTASALLSGRGAAVQAASVDKLMRLARALYGQLGVAPADMEGLLTPPEAQVMLVRYAELLALRREVVTTAARLGGEEARLKLWEEQLDRKKANLAAREKAVQAEMEKQGLSRRSAPGR